MYYFLSNNYDSKNKAILSENEYDRDICDNCGANMPVDAAECCQCKHPTGLPTTKLPPMSLWLNWLARMALITIGLIFILAVLYFSFYLITAIVIAFLIIGFKLFLSDQFLHRR